MAILGLVRSTALDLLTSRASPVAPVHVACIEAHTLVVEEPSAIHGAVSPTARAMVIGRLGYLARAHS